MDAEILARIQFAFTVGFHYIFPPMSIGLGMILVIMETLYIRTGSEFYEKMTKFWVKVFALTFAMGVATGIVMEFQFGTNWSNYSRYVGDVFGSALAAEGIFAFFLESGFLAILVFGWDKVSKKMHFVSTILVALGAHLSAVWILVANSWQQTPAGFHIVGEGVMQRAEITDFWALVFNPSSMDRLFHSISAAWITGAFLVLSVSAWYLLKNRHTEFAKKSIQIGIIVILITSFLQLITGHDHAKTVAKYQPAKMAAYEGHYETGPADLYLVGWVDEKNETTAGIKIPGMLSWLIDWNTETPVTGLKEFVPEDRPPTNLVFQSYHAMVAIGMFFIAMGLIGAFLLWRGKLFRSKWYLRLLVISVVLPHLANQLGWISAEVGRQPWIVYNLLRTSDGISQSVNGEQVLFSLILFIVVYIILFFLFLFLLDRKIKAGPEIPENVEVTYKKQREALRN